VLPAFVTLIQVHSRLGSRYGDDPTVAAETLQRRYAGGELSEAEFGRRLDLVMEEGVGALSDEGDGDDADSSGAENPEWSSGDGTPRGTADPPTDDASRDRERDLEREQG